jgi:tetratricopeptide (TPR) repeat protein
MESHVDDLSLSVAFEARCPLCATPITGARWVVLDAACARYREAATHAASLGAIAQQATALGNLGNVHGRLQRFEEARHAHAAALDLAWSAADDDLVRKTADGLRLDLRGLGQAGVAEATALAGKAVEAWTARAPGLAQTGFDAATRLIDEQLAPMELADMLDTAGQVHLAASDYPAAVAATERATDLARAHDDPRRLADFLLNLSAAHLSAGRLSKAGEAATESLAVSRKHDQKATAVKALGNLGTVCEKQGQYSKAEYYLRRQYLLARESADEPQWAAAANAYGAHFLGLGSDQRAAALLEEALSLAEKHAREELIQRCQAHLAIVARRRGDRAVEETLLTKVLTRAEALDMADVAADASLGLVRLLMGRGDVRGAVTRLATAADLIEGLDDDERRARLWTLRGHLALAEARSADARDAFLAAGYAIAEASPEASADCFVEAAAISFQQLLDEESSTDPATTPEDREHLLDHVLAALERAVSTYERTAQKLEDHRLWMLVRRQEKGLRLYADAIRKRHGSAAALAIVERGRSRALRLAMHRRAAGHRTSIYRSKQILSQVAHDLLTDPSMPGATIDLPPDALQRAFSAFGRTVGHKEPEIAALGEQDLATVAARAGAPVIEYAFDSQDRLGAWLVSDGPLRFIELPLDDVGGIDGLRQSIADLHAGIGHTRDLDAEPSRLRSPSPEALHLLYRALIQPIASALPATVGAPVAIVPDGPLFDVPFAALRAPDDQAVIDRWAIFLVPAIHFFAVPPERPGRGCLIAGDPVPPAAAKEEWGEIARLPFARTEALEVARLHGVDALVDADATRRAIAFDWTGAELVHLAAHAVLSPSTPFESAIVLAASDDDDGLIRVRDIDEVGLRARLVVLSCCSTAGGVVTGDGVLSLCRGLLAAGAHSVLASLWAVNDESTRFTMVDFHRRLVAAPRRDSLAETFRQSQLATRTAYPHYSQWAPFVLWGWPNWLDRPEWQEQPDSPGEQASTPPVLAALRRS